MRLVSDESECPEGWCLSTVGDSCVIRDDLRLPLSVETRRSMQGSYPYYGPTGVLDRLNEYRVEGIFALIGEDGDHFLKFTEWPMTQLVSGRFNVNNHAHLLQGGNGCTTEWVYHYFNHMDLKPVLTLQGVGRYKLTRGSLEKLPILIPPLPEQERIHCALSVWNKAIHCVVDLIGAKQRIKASLMEQLLTGQRRFPRFVQSKRMRQTRFGPVPAEWEDTRIGEIAEEVNLRNEDGADIPVLSCTKHDGLVKSLEYFGRRVFSEDTTKYKLVRRGQFAYATNHIEEGSIGLLADVEAGLVSPMYTVFAPSAAVHPVYLFLLLKTDLYRHIFQVNTSASVDRRGSLRWGEFSRIKIALPSRPEQIRIAECIMSCQEEISSLERKRRLLQKQKRSLMEDLLTGKVRMAATVAEEDA